MGQPLVAAHFFVSGYASEEPTDRCLGATSLNSLKFAWIRTGNGAATGAQTLVRPWPARLLDCSESIAYNLAAKTLLKHSKYMAVGAVGLGGGLCLNDVDFAEYNSGSGRDSRGDV